MYKLAVQIYMYVNIIASNSREIEIFVSEYTFSGALIKKVFLEILIEQNNNFYEFNGRIYLSVNISANYSFISELFNLNIGRHFQGQL